MPIYHDAMLSREFNTSRLLGCLVQSVASFLKEITDDERLLIIGCFICFVLMYLCDERTIAVSIGALSRLMFFLLNA